MDNIFHQFNLESGTEIKLNLNPKYEGDKSTVLQKRFDLPHKVNKKLSSMKWVVNSVTVFGPVYGKVFIYNLINNSDRLIKLRLISGEDVLLPGNKNPQTPLSMRITIVPSHLYFA